MSNPDSDPKNRDAGTTEFLLPGLDPQQLGAVLSDRNTVVSAGAGSGKTTVLAERYLRLIVDSRASVPEILTLTFTRKAAAEMHARIYSRLLAAPRSASVDRALVEFDRAQISTLDSFCAQIARLDSARFGVARDFDTNEQRVRELNEKTSLAFLLAHAENPGLIRLIADNGFEPVWRNCFVELASEYLHLSRSTDFDAVFRNQSSVLDAAATECAVAIGEVRDAFHALGPVGTGGKTVAALTQAFDRLGEWQGLFSAGNLDAILQQASAFSAIRRPGGATNPAVVAAAEILEQAKAVSARVREVVASLRLRPIQESLFEVLAEFGVIVAEQRRAQGVLTFRDVVEMAVAILRENGDVRRYYRRRFRYIMIDEFQDNNSLQRDLLFLLAGREDDRTEDDGPRGGDRSDDDRSRYGGWSDDTERRDNGGSGDHVGARGDDRHTGDPEHPLPIPASESLDREKLFFVGDEKQSIYRFRGADVSVFKHLLDDLAGAGGLDLSLDTNYRSDPRLIDFFNRIFPHIMGDALAPFEARFRKLEPGVAAFTDTGSQNLPIVELFYRPFRPVAPQDTREDTQDTREDTRDGREDTQDTREDTRDGREDTADSNSRAEFDADSAAAPSAVLDADDAEAFAVVRYVYDAVEGPTPMELPETRPDGSVGLRTATYDDFALLLRSASNQIRYERMFRAFGVPYTSESVRSLFLEAPVNDLYNLLQLVIYPSDRVAYAAVLRGPFVAISDHGLAEVLLAQIDSAGRAIRAPFQQLAETVESLLHDVDRDRYARGVQMYHDLCARVDREPVEALLRRLWYFYGYRYLLMQNPSYHPYLEFYDYLTELARTSGASTTAEFLDLIRPHLGKYERLQELSVLRDEVRGVQVMTIHKAKGLEFPVVILANLGNTGRREGSGSSPYYLHSTLGPTFNLIPDDAALNDRRRSNYFYTLGTEEDDAAALAELKRVLYVGATRARSRLVLSGVHNRNNQNTVDAPLNLMLDAMRAERYIDEANQAKEANQGSASQAFRLHEIPDVTERDVEQIRLRPQRPDLEEFDRNYAAATVVERPIVRTRFTATELNRAGVDAAAMAAAGSSAERQLPAIECDGILDRYGLEAAFGTLCHRLIQRSLERLGESASDTGQLVTFAIEAAGQLSLPLAGTELPAVARDAARLVRGFLESELWRRLSAGMDNGGVLVESEVPFVLKREIAGAESFVRGQIDLVTLRRGAPAGGQVGHSDSGSNAALTVIDFKTDRIVRPAEYDLQLQLYAEAAEALYELSPANVTLCYLREFLKA